MRNDKIALIYYRIQTIINYRKNLATFLNRYPEAKIQIIEVKIKTYSL